jgi:DNA-binding CsgD family transcriptional regulator
MPIGDADVRALLRIAEQPGDGGDGGPLPAGVLEALAGLFRADAVQLLRLDVDRRETPLYQEHSTLSAPADVSDDVFWAQYWDAPFCSYPDRTGDLSRVTTASDFGPVQHSRLWQEYFRPHGVYREMMLCLQGPHRRTARLLLSRGPGRDFNDRDRALLTLLRPHLDARLRRWERQAEPSLTPRQRELLGLVAAGWTNRRIGRQLGITEGTVRSHLENVFERLRVTNRTAAVARAFPDGYPSSHPAHGVPA